MTSKIRLLKVFLMLFCSAACAHQQEHEMVEAQCFWMENYSGKYRWVDANAVYQMQLTKAECFQLDSCDGGMGESGGGCYKWARSPNAERLPW